MLRVGGATATLEHQHPAHQLGVRAKDSERQRYRTSGRFGKERKETESSKATQVTRERLWKEVKRGPSLGEMLTFRGTEKDGPAKRYGSNRNEKILGLMGAGNAWKQQLRHLFLKKSRWSEPRLC